MNITPKIVKLFYHSINSTQGFPGASVVKNLPSMQEAQLHSLGWENPLEKGMTTHSIIFAWIILWTEEPGATAHGVAESNTTERLAHRHTHIHTNSTQTIKLI